MSETYDLVLIHPPSVFDFRKKVWFPGPISQTVRSTSAFIVPPIGMISIADCVDRRGYKVKVLNLGEKMLMNPRFNPEYFLKKIDSRIFGVGLHWCVHVHGAIEVAKLCKQIHPDSLIILGGLTATRFHSEIIRRYPFVDAVVRGEGEESVTKLISAIYNGGDLNEVYGLTIRGKNNAPITTGEQPQYPIDRYEFSRFDLLEPALESVNLRLGHKNLKIWSIPICRGCVYNCATCGGSKYAYEKLLRRPAPSFRSPEKILDDFKKLDEEGFNSIFLFQDCRMAGEKYYKNLFKTLNKEHWSKIEHVTLELFTPVNEAFINYIKCFPPADKVSFTISPESGDEMVRLSHGRNYSNKSLFNTIRLTQGNEMPLSIFFMGILARETAETIVRSWTLWDKILKLNSGRDPPLVDVEFGPMIILDPGSLSFENPERYGYRILYGTLEEHRKAMSEPGWNEWVNYETENMSPKEITNFHLRCVEELIRIKYKNGLMDKTTAELRLIDLKFEGLLLKKLCEARDLKSSYEKSRELEELFIISRDSCLKRLYVATSSEYPCL